MQKLKTEIEEHLRTKLIPFWERMQDDVFGGYYGYMGYDLKVVEAAEKGGILNSRILWFFSVSAKMLKDDSLREFADHAWRFFEERFWDHEYGGVYWSVRFYGKPKDDSKHTYCQAFAIYGLCAYYELTKNEKVLQYALKLYEIIENRLRDSNGYLEAFDREFKPVDNDKLSENGVEAKRTMNTLLHIFEAYTQLYKITGREDVAQRMREILTLFEEKLYNREKHRMEVFFDTDYHSLIDLTSYGHDIETAWLLDLGLEILGDEDYKKRLRKINDDITREIFQKPFDGHSLPAECEGDTVLADRVWWVQAECLTGFINGYEYNRECTEYLDAAKAIWEYIKVYLVDPREGSEWYWVLDAFGKPIPERPIVEPWKCPYHNGRMCLEVIRRIQ